MSFNRKKERLFLTLILCIGLMAGIASAVGLLSVGGPGPWEYQAVGGEWVQIVGEGIYRNDSVSYERPAGYLLSSAIIIKGSAMLTAMSAMMISMKWSGVPMSTIEILLFPAFNLLMILALVLLMKKCK